MKTRANQPVVTFRQLLNRSRMLARLNRRTSSEKYHPDFRRWIELAADEARTGETANWSPPSREETLKRRIADLEGRPLRQRIGAKLAAARAELAALDAGEREAAA